MLLSHFIYSLVISTKPRSERLEVQRSPVPQHERASLRLEGDGQGDILSCCRQTEILIPFTMRRDCTGVHYAPRLLSSYFYWMDNATPQPALTSATGLMENSLILSLSRVCWVDFPVSVLLSPDPYNTPSPHTPTPRARFFPGPRRRIRYGERGETTNGRRIASDPRRTRRYASS